MIILLHGKDTYRKKKKLEEIVEEYKKKHPSGLNIKVFHDDVTFEDISDENRQSSMFEEKRLIIVYGALSKVRDSFIKKAQEIPPNIVVFFEEEVRKNDASLKHFSLVQEFSPLPRSKVLAFLKKNARTEIDDSAAQLLVDFVGSDLWRLSMEMEKLSSYSSKITEESVRLLVRPQVETNIFKTLDALSEGKKDVALSLIYEHLQEGDHPLYIISMIEYQLRNLLLVRSALDEGVSDIAKHTGLHPFVARKSISQAKAFSWDRLKRIHFLLFDTDFKAKTGQIDPVNAIHVLFLNI